MDEAGEIDGLSSGLGGDVVESDWRGDGRGGLGRKILLGSGCIKDALRIWTDLARCFCFGKGVDEASTGNIAEEEARGGVLHDGEA